MPCLDDCCVDESQTDLSGKQMADDRSERDGEMTEPPQVDGHQAHGLRAMRSVESFSFEMIPESDLNTDEVTCSKLMQKMRSTDFGILRGTTISQSLRGGGSLWQKNPKELDIKHREALFQKSQPVESLDVFISHPWASKGWSKVLSLLMQSGCSVSLVCWFLGALLALLLCLEDVLPMPLRYVAQTATFTAMCPTGPWIMIFGLVGTFMGLLLSPYRPQQGDVCFIDAACIHQTNIELMHRGIRGIGGFLLVARELRILWSPAYLTRLWCVFELATYKRLNPNGKIVLAPLFLEKIVLLFYLGNSCVSYCFLLLRGSGAATQIALPGILFCWLPFLLTVHHSRRNYVQKHQLVSQFENFDLDSVECAEESDREFVNTAIVELYGSKEAFTSFVRGPLRQELLEPICRTPIPGKYVFWMVTPTICMQAEFLLSLWKGGAPLDVFLIYLFSMCIVGVGAHWQASMSLISLLCDHLAEPAFKQMWACDYLQTLLILFMFLLYTALGMLLVYVPYYASSWPLFLCLFWVPILLFLLIHWLQRRSSHRKMLKASGQVGAP